MDLKREEKINQMVNSTRKQNRNIPIVFFLYLVAKGMINERDNLNLFEL